MSVQVERPTVMEFDHIMEEHKQRKLADVAEAERMLGMAERGRESATQELATLQGELAAVKGELATFKEELGQRKADWEASIGRIQQAFDAREATIVSTEAALGVRDVALKASEDRNRHQWTLLHEAVEQVKVILEKHLAGQTEALTALTTALPAGVDTTAAPAA